MRGKECLPAHTSIRGRGLIIHAHFVEDEEENLSLVVKSQKDFIPLHPQTD